MTNISPIIFNVTKTGGFLVNIIGKLITATGALAIGILLFTLILKLITLPFDAYSKVSMRKNSLKMEQMRPELEKLQKQYANDKVLYNQKMMALYKRNGYSMWGSCLPLILTIVIFIVAINAFSSFSAITNQTKFQKMSNSYNSVIYEGIVADGEIFVYDSENNVLTINQDKVKEYLDAGTSPEGVNITKIANTKTYTVQIDTNGYIVYECSYTSDLVFNGQERYLINGQAVKDSTQFASAFATFNAESDNINDFAKKVLVNEARERSAQTFKDEDTKFIWIKNIWVADSAFKNPVHKDFNEFLGAFNYDKKQITFNENDYNELVYNLAEEKEQSNGWFILVVLTVGITFLSQIIMTKSQKAQMELQTVDGQGMQSQNMMKWMMPIMMGVFAFAYTSAFSIYIIVSSAAGIITTLLINFFVDKKFKKVESANATSTVRGRIYTPKPEEKKEEPKKKKKTTPEYNFLTGTADKKKGKR